MSVIDEIGSSVVHTTESLRVIVQPYVCVSAAGTVTGVSVTGLVAGETVLSVGPARAVDNIEGRNYHTPTRGTGANVGFTTVGAVTGTPTINLAFLVFSPSKVVL